MWFTPFAERGTIMRTVSKPSCLNSGAGHNDTTTTGPSEEYVILVWAKKIHKLHYITLTESTACKPRSEKFIDRRYGDIFRRSVLNSGHSSRYLPCPPSQ